MQNNLSYVPFLDSFFEQINKVGLDVTGLPLDHIAYQASTKDDYEKLLPDFSKLGELVSEEIIGGRRVAVVKLAQPLGYKAYSISALELIEPKEGQQCDSAFQHAEFVANQPFEDYIKQYPNIEWDTSSMHRDEFSHLKLNFDNGLTLKFLQRPILELFEEKKEMRITPINPKNEMDDFRGVVESAFSTTPDSSLDEWLSFPYMKLMMEEKRGFGLKAVDDDGNWVGAIYAQQENPVNGKEGEEKWVIIVAGTDAKHTGGGIGSQLLSELEALARKHDVKKLFTFTNKDDEQVINFYRKNGYEDAGWIKDYQYGGNNSAVFLLKHLI